MFKRFFKKDTAPVVEQKSNVGAGFFSTHDFTPSAKKTIDDILSIAFPRNKTHIEHGANGIAMDNTIQEVKATSANLSVSIPAGQLSWYAGQGFIGYQLCAMLSQNWLIDKACTMPARDAARNGYEITVNNGVEVNPEILDYIAQADKRYDILNHCVQFVRNCRIFGIRIAMFEVDSTDPEYYEKPFNPDGVTAGSYKGIAQIDPYWIAPMLGARAASDVSAKDFYEPTWWLINGKKVHRSHLAIIRRSELPDILKPAYLYGGIPLPQQMAERVYAAERTANEAPLLAMTKRLITLKMDMAQAAVNSHEFNERMNTWVDYMNNFGVKIHGETEEVNQFDTSLADLDAVIMTQYQIVSAESEVPATKLLGTSPKGFNATGEFEMKNYNQFLESIQRHDMSKLVERHHLLLMRSEVAPKFGIQPFKTSIVWNSPDSPSAAEIADINLKKSQADTAWSNAGAVDSIDIRNRLIADETSGYSGIPEIVPDMPSEAEQDNAEVTN